jgi:hypothetical protein
VDIRPLSVDFPRSRRHLTGIAGGLLEGHGTDAAKVAVAPFPIVKDLDVIEQIAPCLSTRSIDVPSNTFLLETAEERLRDGIVPAVASPAHARDELVRAAETLPVVVTCPVSSDHGLVQSSLHGDLV